jgi:hypothetical protein
MGGYQQPVARMEDVMKWTPDAIICLRRLAPRGGRALAEHFGISTMAAHKQAQKLRIAVGQRGFQRKHDLASDAALRAHWQTIIGPMRRRLREEIELDARGWA